MLPVSGLHTITSSINKVEDENRPDKVRRQYRGNILIMVDELARGADEYGEIFAIKRPWNRAPDEQMWKSNHKCPVMLH